MSLRDGDAANAGCAPAASVVISSRDRPEELSRCLKALSEQRTDREFEVIVVDNGSTPALSAGALGPFPGARLIRVEGRGGPAAARNLGIEAAGAEVVLFTDDDTTASPRWLEAACDFLDAHPDHVGVEGKVISPDYDPLYAQSVESHGPGAYLTCNVAYRRPLLRRLGGFALDYFRHPYPHCEDVDLAFRAMEAGEIGFSEEMEITHYPRLLKAGQFIAQARLRAPSEALFAARYRRRLGRAGRVPPRLFPVLTVALQWRNLLRREGLSLLRAPRRLGRFVLLSVGQVIAVMGGILTWRKPNVRKTPPQA